MLRAVKVEHVVPDAVLPPEAESIELPTTQHLPESPLGGRRLPAEHAADVL